MQKFQTELHVKPVTDEPGYWEVLEPLQFMYKGRIITVPAGIQTDFASVPRILWVILPPSGVYTESAVLHDYLYETGGSMYNSKPLTRAQSDLVFLEAMQSQGVSFVTSCIMYFGVRLFGSFYWKKS